MKEQELNTLIEIGKVIARVQDRQELLRTIFEKIQPIFNFYDVGLFIVNQEENYHVDLATVTPGISPSQANYEIAKKQEPKIPHRSSALEWIMREASNDGGTIILDFDQIIQRFPNYPHVPVMKKAGLKESLVALLRVQGETIGMFCINALKKGFFDSEHIPLFQAITDQLAVAVSNVLANEQLLEEKQFKEVLLKITEAVAKINDRKALLQVIFNHVQSVQPFEHAGLFIIDEDSDTFLEILDEGTLDDLQDQLSKEGLLGPWPYSGQHPDSWIYTKEPALFEVEEQFRIIPNPQWEHLMKNGSKQLMACPLWMKGKKTGLICLLSKEQDFYTKKHFPLFQAIADQLAVAISNVLATEQLKEEKRFKETLLRISESVAIIQNKQELLKFIFGKIRRIFPYDEFGLFVVDEDGSTHSEIIDESIMTQSEAQSLIEQKLGKNAIFSHVKSSVEWLMENGPVISSMEDLDARAYHPQHQYMIEGGIKTIIGGPLFKGKENFGMLCFTSKTEGFYKERDIPLFRAISEQLSVAVTNVLANEEILRRQLEKEALLKISKKIATIRNQQDLNLTLVRDLQPIFNFMDAVVLVIDTENDCYYPLAFVAPEEIRQNPYFESVSKFRYRYKGSPQEKLFNSFKPAEFLIDDLLKAYPGFEPLLMLQKAGVKKTLGISLNQGGKAIGSLLFHYSNEYKNLRSKYDLFAQINDQISVAVANILANQGLEQRELEESLKLSMVNALNEGTDWEEKLLAVTLALKQQLPFHLISYGIVNDLSGVPNLAFEQIGAGEYRTIDIPTFLKLSQMEADLFAKEAVKDMYTTPVILNGEDYVQKCRQNQIIKQTNQVFQVNSSMIIPLAVGQDRLLYVTFYDRNPNKYQLEHLQLFQRIAPSFMLALEKQLHYQEIIRLNELISEEKAYLEKELQLSYNFGEIVGSSEAMQNVFEQVQQVANTQSSVLITGETGTGKELIARALHNYSNRSKHNFIKLNCATLPAELLESELFGHEKGAFTGAHQRRIGKFELANKGTIFLDEIGEMPLELQAKLLRVLQEREFERLGGNEVLQTDVRVVAATNRNLQSEVAKGDFRNDLYYRLNVFPIHLPSLRDRKEDIPELARHFIEKHNKRVGKKLKRVSEKALKDLVAYHWPGNVRELEHVIERSMISAKTSTLEVVLERAPVTVDNQKDTTQQPLKTYKNAEIDLIMNTLKFTDGKISGEGGAAEILDLHPATLESKMRKLGIKRQHVIQGTGKDKK